MKPSPFSKHVETAVARGQEGDAKEEEEEEEEDEEQLITATFTSVPKAETSECNMLPASTCNLMASSVSSLPSAYKPLHGIRTSHLECVDSGNEVHLVSGESMDSESVLSPKSDPQSGFFSDGDQIPICSGRPSNCGHTSAARSLLQPFGSCLCAAGSAQSSLSSASTTTSTKPLVGAVRRPDRFQVPNLALPSSAEEVAFTRNHSGLMVPPSNLSRLPSVNSHTGSTLYAPSSVHSGQLSASSPSSATSTKQFIFGDASALIGAQNGVCPLNERSASDNRILKLNLDQLNATGNYALNSMINIESSIFSDTGSEANDRTSVKHRNATITTINAPMLPTGHTSDVPSAGSTRPLSLYEKRYLLAVERGDLAGVRRMIELAAQMQQSDGAIQFNINCTDPLGRSALLMAIDNENLDMIELLVECGVEMRDSLLHAINEEFVEAVELLLDYEEALQRNRALAERNATKASTNSLPNNLITYRFDSRPTLLPANSHIRNTAQVASTPSSSATNEPDMVTPGSSKFITTTGVSFQNDSMQMVTATNASNVSMMAPTSPAISHAPGVPNTATASSMQVQHLYSWEGFERETFTSDVTPLILASHKNNYEIIKLLLDRGISPLPCPHDARCGCRECTAALQSDCLRYSRSRINAYRALASPSLIGTIVASFFHFTMQFSSTYS